jgi:malonyl-CoA O-methyltransferase
VTIPGMDDALDRRALLRDFDTAAETYDKVAVLQRTVAERLVERLEIINITPDRIVDLGSGSGAGANLLTQRYRRARILQVDLAPAMLRLARKRAPRWFSRQHFVQADARSLPLAAGMVDMVFSNLMLQWLEQPAAAFTEIRYGLRTGGLLMFSSFGPDTLKELRASWAAVDEAPHVHRFMDMHDLGDALVRAGFEHPVMEMEQITLTYGDCQALMRELQQLGAQNVHIGRRRSLTGRRRMQAMIAAYEQYRQADRLPATFEVIYGHAWASAVRSGGEVRVPISHLRHPDKRA